MIKTFKQGDLAYFDSWRGLEKCRVLEVKEPGDGRRSKSGIILIETTHRNHPREKYHCRASQVVPRSMVRVVNHQYRINVNYQWIVSS